MVEPDGKIFQQDYQTDAQRNTHENRAGLKTRICKYFDIINKEPIVFRWTYKMKHPNHPSSDDSINI